MNPPEITALWMERSSLGSALRADFSNDTHHRLPIDPPCGPKQVAQALFDLAFLLEAAQV